MLVTCWTTMPSFLSHKMNEGVSEPINEAKKQDTALPSGSPPPGMQHSGANFVNVLKNHRGKSKRTAGLMMPHWWELALKISSILEKIIWFNCLLFTLQPQGLPVFHHCKSDSSLLHSAKKKKTFAREFHLFFVFLCFPEIDFSWCHKGKTHLSSVSSTSTDQWLI